MHVLLEWEGRMGVHSGVGGALLLPLFDGSVCVACAREKEGRLKGLCLLFYELDVGFL